MHATIEQRNGYVIAYSTTLEGYRVQCAVTLSDHDGDPVAAEAAALVGLQRYDESVK